MRGLNDYVKRKSIMYYLREKADVVCLQETHCTESNESIWQTQWGGATFWSHGSNAARGVGILIRKNTDIEILNNFSDNTGRVVGIQYKEKHETFTLINIYAPNEDSPDFFVEVFKLFEQYPGKRILTGDFNLVMDVKLDSINADYRNNDRSSKILDEYMEDTMMCDIWRTRNTESKIYTCFRRKPKLSGTRLDMFVTEIGFSSWISQAKIHPKYMSDHASVSIEINPNEVVRGRGSWKLNNRILYESEYLMQMNKVTKMFQNDDITNDAQQKWEAMKINAIATSQQYSAERALNRTFVINQLESQVVKYNLVGLENLSKQELDLYERTQGDLDAFKNDRMQGVLFRTQATWYNDSEASTKYFYNLEKLRSGAKNMSCILLENNEIVTDPNKILHEQHNFYRKLYKSDPEIAFKYENTSLLKLPVDLKTSMEGSFTMDELAQAIKGMKRNKSPGLDGLTSEFYVMFFNNFKELLLAAINEAFVKGNLHDSAMRGVINLIPKKSRDSRKIQNQRPITILCTDYKLVEKMLANRIKPALDFLINEDQKGFMSKRSIACNIRRILDLAEYTEQEEIPAVVVSIDFLKCFDRIEIPALLAALKYFEFGEDFIRWTSIIYQNATACIANNGHFSKYFPVTRGVKQGGPCSAYYFLIIAEILAIELRKNTDIKGIWIKDILKVLGQYADDIDLYLWGERKSIETAFQVISIFCGQTGFKINYDKTTMYRIGSLRRSEAILYTQHNVIWTNNSINVLGVDVCYGKKERLKINYSNLIKKSQTILTKWKNRGLSLFGKIMIVNVLIASLFVYKMSVIEKITTEYVTQLNSMIKEFLWNSKRSKIRLEVLQMSKEMGGANLVNFDLKAESLQVSWIKNMLTDNMICTAAHTALHPSLKNDIWVCNINDKDIKSNFQESYWREVLLAWSKIQFDEPHSIREIMSQMIWFNTFLKVKKMVIFLPKAYEAGLKKLNQLYDTEGNPIAVAILCQQYNLTILECNALFAAIPKRWKKIIEESKNNFEHTALISKYEIFIQRTKCASWYYKERQSRRSVLAEVFNRWQNEGRITADFDEFSEAFVNLYRITNQAKLRSFQYRLLHRAVLLNSKLKTWKIIQSEMCTQCNDKPETYYHFFWECKMTQQVWKWLEEKCKKVSENDQCDLTYKNVILNKINERTSHIFNTLLLVTKQMLYANRCLKRPMRKLKLFNRFQQIERFELYQAIKSNKVPKHVKKWCIIEDNKVVSNHSDLDENYIENYILNM